MISDDMALVQEYAQSNSERAFSTLVSKHVNLVYSVALRQVRDPLLAEEITQSVFIILARKAKSLSPMTILSGWLCRTARNVSADTLKIQRRRQIREQESQMHSILNEPEPGVWNQVAPMLDEALGALGEKEHDAVVLRFFDGKELKHVGAAMGTTEDAARMRVNRGVEKLREFFAKRGVTLSATAIAGAVAANSVQAAPIGLAAAIITAAFSGTAITTATVTAASKGIAMTTLQKTIITTAFAVAVGTGIYQAREAAKTREDMQTLQQQQAPLTEQILALRNQLQEAAQQLGALRASQPQDLLRLRNEVGLLRQERNALAQQLSEVRRGLEANFSQSNPTINPIPGVRFGSYIDAAGNAVSGKADQATFEFENPSASLVICAFHRQNGPRDMVTGGPLDALISIQPKSTNSTVFRVGQTNSETLSVKVMRVVSSHELSVPVP
jgi:RNA polymerase sigma factor (sigma-70 family)